MEGTEPENTREDEGEDRVEEEEPVEDDETNGYVVALDDCAHGDDERDSVEDSEDHADYGQQYQARCILWYFLVRAELVTKGPRDAVSKSAVEGHGDAPLRSISVKMRFLKTSGAFQRMLNAIMTPPAASRKKSKAPQMAINTRDTIIVDCFYGSNPVHSSRDEGRHGGGRQPPVVPLAHGCPRRLTRRESLCG